MQNSVPHENSDFASSLNNKPSWYGRLPITITLAVAIGTLVLTTAVVVFGVGVWLARKNAFDLLSANAQQAIEADVNQIQKHLRPAEYMAEFMAVRIARGDFDPTNRDDFGRMLVGALSGVPQVEAVMFIDADLQALVAGRASRENGVQLNVVDKSHDPVIRENFLKVQNGLLWVPPIWRDDAQRAYFSRAHPIVELFDDEYAFIYKTLSGFGQQPLIVGSYFQASDFPEEIELPYGAAAPLARGCIVSTLSVS